MIDAYYAYFRWGAVKKAESLQEQHPQLFADDTRQEEPSTSVKMLKKVLSAGTPGGDDFTGAPGLRIPGEEMPDLSAEEGSHHQAQRYLKLAMERAGADKGCLILEKDGELFIDAVRGNGEDEAAGIPVALKNCANISTAVVRYVARTNETVVLNDGDDPGIFSGDPYIEQHRFKSMLCLPVMLKGIPAGVLYLENTLLSGVFTPDQKTVF